MRSFGGACAIVMAFCLVTQASAASIGRAGFSAAAVNINFDNLPNHTLVSTQYQALGVNFSGVALPQTNSDFIGSYGPLASPPNILVKQGGNIINLTFVNGLAGTPAPTSGVGADIIFRDTGDVVTLEVFGAGGASLGSATTPPDTGVGDEVFLGFAANGILTARLTFDAGDTTVGIDDLIFEPVVPEPASALLLLAGAIAPAGACLRKRRCRSQVSRVAKMPRPIANANISPRLSIASSTAPPSDGSSTTPARPSISPS